MRLIAPKSHVNTMDGLTEKIFDEDRNDEVGEVRYQKGENRKVSLFGDRYTATVKSHDELVGFLKGVETVLNHILE